MAKSIRFNVQATIDKEIPVIFNPQDLRDLTKEQLTREIMEQARREAIKHVRFTIGPAEELDLNLEE